MLSHWCCQWPEEGSAQQKKQRRENWALTFVCHFLCFLWWYRRAVLEQGFSVAQHSCSFWCVPERIHHLALMISQPVAMGPPCHHTHPTLSILSQQASTVGLCEPSSQHKKVMRTTEPGYNDKNSCHEHAQLQGSSEEVPRKDFPCALNTQGSDTETGPQTSCGTADTTLLQSSINEKCRVLLYEYLLVSSAVWSGITGNPKFINTYRENW